MAKAWHQHQHRHQYRTGRWIQVRMYVLGGTSLRRHKDRCQGRGEQDPLTASRDARQVELAGFLVSKAGRARMGPSLLRMTGNSPLSFVVDYQSEIVKEESAQSSKTDSQRNLLVLDGGTRTVCLAYRARQQPASGAVLCCLVPSTISAQGKKKRDYTANGQRQTGSQARSVVL